MKNKLGLLVLSVFAVLSLTSCQYLYSLIEGFGSETSSQEQSTPSSNPSSDSSSGSSSSSSSSSSGSSSSSQGSQSSSSAESSSSSQQEDIQANRASVNYMDYVKHNAYSLSSTPTVGSAKILVIPVWFSDSTSFVALAKRDNVREDIQKAYFGTNEETGWRSVKTYYEEESHGALTITGTVSEWYECGSKYTNYRIDGNVSKTTSLVESAVTWYFSNHNDTRRSYDCDGDGYLDGVMLIYAAPDNKAMNNESYENLWAYCYWAQDVSKKSVSNPGANAFFWASYDFMYGSNSAYTRAGTNYNSGDTRYTTVDSHTFIHEMGHMFGLEDYYDYSGQYDPAGSFSMQDYNVGGHDAFSSFALGWGKAYVPTSSITINLKPFATTGEMILLSPSFNTYNSPFDEYLLIEYYTATGLNQFDTTHQYMSYYPTGTTQSGIRLWHVDARLVYVDNSGQFSPNRLTTNPNMGPSYGVTLAMSNTYDDGKEATSGYLSPLGSSYYNYNILQMIRNSTTATYTPAADTQALSSNTLFKAGSSFSMSKYSRQFVNTGKLNSRKDLGFSFSVDTLNSEYATITVTKL